jgi:hypothetical protein
VRDGEGVDGREGGGGECKIKVVELKGEGERKREIKICSKKVEDWRFVIISCGGWQPYQS